MLSGKLAGFEVETLAVHAGLGGVEWGDLACLGAGFGESHEVSGKLTLLLMDDEVLAEGEDVDGETLSFRDEAAFGVTHFEFGGGDELGGEFLFQFQAVGEGKGLIKGNGSGEGRDAAFGLELGADGRVWQASST